MSYFRPNVKYRRGHFFLKDFIDIIKKKVLSKIEKYLNLQAKLYAMFFHVMIVYS